MQKNVNFLIGLSVGVTDCAKEVSDSTDETLLNKN